MSTCLQFIDFFSIPSQRTALTISLNCCKSATLAQVNLVMESSQLLIQKLNQVVNETLYCMRFSYIKPHVILYMLSYENNYFTIDVYIK